MGCKRFGASEVELLGKRICELFRHLFVCKQTNNASNAFQNVNVTNATLLFVAAVGRFQNVNCVSEGVAVTVIRQGLGVEMKGMDTVLNVLLNRLTLEWKVV